MRDALTDEKYYTLGEICGLGAIVIGIVTIVILVSYFMGLI
jgi:hypothetical protein